MYKYNYIHVYKMWYTQTQYQDINSLIYLGNNGIYKKTKKGMLSSMNDGVIHYCSCNEL